MFPESMKKLERSSNGVTESPKAYFEYADKITGESVKVLFGGKKTQKKKPLVMKFRPARKGMSNKEFSEQFDIKVKKEPMKGNVIDWIIFAVEFIALMGGMTLLGMNLFPMLKGIAILGISFVLATIIHLCIYIGTTKDVKWLTKFAVISVFIMVFCGIVCSVQKIMQIFAPNFSFWASLVMLCIILIICVTVYALIRTYQFTHRKEGK